jgi:hypothetical protein
MTDAPETIWAVSDVNISAQITDVYAQDTPDGFVDKPTEYTRTDIFQERINEAENQLDSALHSVTVLEARGAVSQARIAELRHALSELLYVQDELPMTGIEATRRADQARTALKAKP